MAPRSASTSNSTSNSSHSRGLGIFFDFGPLAWNSGVKEIGDALFDEMWSQTYCVYVVNHFAGSNCRRFRGAHLHVYVSYRSELFDRVDWRISLSLSLVEMQSLFLVKCGATKTPHPEYIANDAVWLSYCKWWGDRWWMEKAKPQSHFLTRHTFLFWRSSQMMALWE